MGIAVPQSDLTLMIGYVKTAFELVETLALTDRGRLHSARPRREGGLSRAQRRRHFTSVKLAGQNRKKKEEKKPCLNFELLNATTPNF